MFEIIIDSPQFISAIVVTDVVNDDIVGQPEARISALLSVEQALQVVTAWLEGSAKEFSDTYRCYRYSESGYFAVATSSPSGIQLGSWEAASGSDGTDVYSTTNLPFKVSIRPVEHAAG